MNRYRIKPSITYFGGGKHAHVLRKITDEHYRLTSIVDDVIEKSPFDDVPLYRSDDFVKMPVNNFIVSIGMQPYGNRRNEIFDMMMSKGFKPITAVHKTACIETDRIGNGNQFMAGSFVGVESQIWNNCVFNTKASIDHHCIVEDGVVVAPGSLICGSVHIKKSAWIATGAIILPNIVIGERAIVGAGALVRHDVADDETVIGVPAHTK